MNILKDLDLSDFGLTTADLKFEENTLIVTKLNWEYPQALAFQEIMCDRIWHNRNERVFIFCSHPHCLTLGRGLQRNAVIKQALVEFDPGLEAELELPLYRIGRGGGLTFHYPGQLIFYPILSLESHQTKIFDLLMNVLGIYRDTLALLYGLNSLECERELLGLWHHHFKLASIGVSARRFVSLHGLALNLWRDPVIARTLSRVHPCGLSGSTYAYLEDLVPALKRDAFELLSKQAYKLLQERLVLRAELSETTNNLLA